MKIQITKPAQKDLQTIKAYIQQDKPGAAIKTILKIIEAIEYLAESPHLGRSGRVPHTREIIVSTTPFIVVYQVREATIIVLRILHAARQWPKKF